MVDLIAREFLPIELAAELTLAVFKGESILIGSQPSGAGKTALMGALLGLLPAQEEIITIEDERMATKLTLKELFHPQCYIIHEIGKGHWYGYLWGQAVLDTLEFIGDSNQSGRKTRLITNMHPDSLDHVQKTFRKFGSTSHLAYFDCLIFINYESRRNIRYIREVWDKNYNRDFSQLYNSQVNAFKPNEAGEILEIVEFYQTCLNTQITFIEDVAEEINKTFCPL